VQNTIRVLAAKVGFKMEGGPTSQPTLHPVAAKDSRQEVRKYSLGGREETHFPRIQQ
jgi:hypothetical protein